MGLTAELDDEGLDRAFEMGFGSLRGTLHHLWAAERVWLDRWAGKAEPVYPDMEAGLAMADLRGRWVRTAGERDALLDQAGPDGYARPVRFTDKQGRECAFALGDLIIHVCNHAMHHRAQALNMLRHVGVKPPGLDYLFMRVDESFAQPPVPDFDLDVIGRYFAYGDWAQERIRAVAATLTDGQLDRPFEMGVGSVRITLVHICDAERWWLDNWIHGPTKEYDKFPPTLSMAELRDVFERTVQGRNAFLDKTDAPALQRETSAWVTPERKLTFVLGETMLQLHNHGTHHRAQVRNMLRHLGADCRPLDYLAWLRETAAECA